ncbi:hypothetical protein A3742_07500 [Oleiphilus sp. HI0071]|nr:hypothetical protein A3737_03775 [Oleiphilus sp. HI0065]KZY83250.1 hypothetical protein A3742_07500 [Oleiphilus sp. HI0071]KZY98849.1 hypothetical protein A3744_13050 [Oleiphilus sp. HI0073]KZZ14847.1 hypothetical protein A3750_13295 [Oleiphilus sp. HI0079]KZZ17418.1 hypothetical protein A3751_11720 [Oleiphilus sp. HI0080]KZZ40932.1 hypothetical protein A3758_08765 [Oleiphilus sp. HI0118]KZZ48909.1 hypothetical protein A3760_22455 [Oleiphilus sp. HI0122]KZZ66632.1 hypothetical protein A37
MQDQASSYIFILLAVIVGFSLASQAGINSQLRVGLSTPIQAAFISFAIGTIVLGLIALKQGEPWFINEGFNNIPWWAWAGGALGAFNIAMSIYLVPKLGALALAISIVGGQVIASLIYDQYGLLGYPKIELSWTRAGGAVLIVIGIWLVSRK